MDDLVIYCNIFNFTVSLKKKCFGLEDKALKWVESYLRDRTS